MMRLLLALLLCFLLTPCLYASSGAGGDISVDAEGYGASKDDAQLQAKREAIEKGIGTVLISQTEVNNFMLQKDLVITQSFGAVRRFSVKEEEQLADGTWRVRIEAVVSLDSIRADLVALKILLESMDKPRMMVLIQEEDGNYAESAVVDYLRGKGFDLVDPAQTAALMQKSDQLIEQATQGDPVAAAKIGAANGAEYVLVGKVGKSQAENPLLKSSGMISGQASLTAKVVNCSNARIIASKSANGAAVHISPDVARSKAAEKAGQKLMDDKLFEEILASFQDTVNNGATVEVTIRNVIDYQAQKSANRLLEETSGVTSVSRRGFFGGEAIYTVVFRGQVDTFCDAVDGKQVAGKKLSVTSVAGSNVVMQLQ
ncbi:MAG: hypothetical protein A2X84_08010 [Desulfuromonadaceae bacterium GWC2_58_13]|nr:MAG: hypothetical protein A2X84_08010 [Desulfuromonadaceae bacterium GWC2_58_13]